MLTYDNDCDRMNFRIKEVIEMRKSVGETALVVLEGVKADLTVRDICICAEVTRSAVAVHLQNLMRAGYIKRRERVCPYEVTEVGEKVLNKRVAMVGC